MPNALLILENAVDFEGTVVTASSEAPAMPATNLQSTRRSKLWRSGAGTTSFVNITFDTKRLVQLFAVVDVNLAESGSIRLQAYSDFQGGNQVYDVTIKPTIYTTAQLQFVYGSGIYGAGNYSLNTPLNSQRRRNITIYELPQSQNWQYWRVTFTDGNTTYQQAARIYLSQFDRFRVNISYGWSANRIERSQKKETLGGQIYTQTRDSRLQIRGQYDFLNADERTRALQIMEGYAETQPLIFSITPENNSTGLTTSLYGTLTSPEVSEDDVNRNSFSFGITEEF